MEIEAKLAVPNRAVYRELLRQAALASYALIPAGGGAQVTDLYLDTAHGDILAAGYACRLRSEGGRTIATLKGLGDASGAIHRRAEHEVELPEWTAEVSAWPESTARALALELTGSAPLQPLFELAQRRVRRDVMDGPRRVAQFSLDDVRAAVGRRPACYYELEIELAPDGTETDLARLAEVLQADWGLVPEPHSKFQRALAVLQRRGAPVSSSLSDEERAALEAYAAGPDAEMARRAAVVLAWSEGLPTREIVARTGLSSGRVRFWLREFRAQRMGIFREPSPPERTPEADAVMAEMEAVPAPVTGRGRKDETRRRGLPTVRQFAGNAGVDLAHARYVSALAAAMFDALRPLHRLPRKRRRLLRQAALLYTAGAMLDPAHPHRAGRDLILSQPMRGVNTNDRLALAALVALNRARVRPEREVSMSALDAKTQENVLAMTALLHVAEALDFSRTQATLIERLESEERGRIYITLSGPAAEVDALQAAGRSGLWYELFGQELVFAVEDGARAGMSEVEAAEEASVFEEALKVGAETPTSAREAPPPIASDEPMSEAGRKILYLHFGRMLANDAGARLGEDIEAVHDMRVATRRMRAAFQIFDPYYKNKAIAPHLKGLRRTGRVLGAVRDLDVLLEKARQFQESLPPADQPTITPLITHWEIARDMARREMVDYLDSQAYREFTEEFEVFLATPFAGAMDLPSGQPTPYLVRHVTPQLLFERYEAVRAYDALLPDAPLTTYHLLRIDGKRLRYALEFFKEVLGSEVGQLIKQVTAMQDQLGELQDAHVAEGLLSEFLGQQQKRKKKDPPLALAGVEAYLVYQHDRQEELVANFAPRWAEITGYDFRRNLGLAVAAV